MPEGVSTATQIVNTHSSGSQGILSGECDLLSIGFRVEAKLYFSVRELCL